MFKGSVVTEIEQNKVLCHSFIFSKCFGHSHGGSEANLRNTGRKAEYMLDDPCDTMHTLIHI